ncbi:MAG: hypothetical protein HY681_02540 [Chloroflexi bacterium]|nr:hypothetical protein [Chloroflexota bacterium]
MLDVIAWLLALELIGLLAFPVLFRLAPWLPDRGYAIAKPIGLVLVFYPLWLLASTPYVPNTLGVLIAIILGLGALSGWLVWRSRASLQEFLRDEWPLMLLAEVVFLGVFVFWTAVISQDSGISHTEQPMDFGFLNATMASRHFPPNDPWLSGAHVSYYYLGYLIFGGLTKLVGIAPAVGYNLALASVGALAAAAAFGLVFNMVRLAGGKAAGAALAGLTAVLLLLFVSNLEGALEMMRAGGRDSAEFWKSVDIKGLDGPKPSDSWYPTEGGWWWWRASRVIDTVQNGQSLDYTITEFPFFSLLLGDLHPHVMGLPFVLSFLGLTLAFFVSVGKGLRWLADNAPLLALTAIVLGALGFINLWDLPVFGGLLLAAAVVKGISNAGGGRGAVATPVLAASAIVALSLALYLPFLFSFESQAKGVLPVDQYVSRPLHFFLVWGLLLTIAGGFMLRELVAAVAQRPRRWKALGVSLLVALSPWALWTLAEGVKLWDAGEALEAAWKRLVHVGPLVVMMTAGGYLALKLARESADGMSTGKGAEQQAAPVEAPEPALALANALGDGGGNPPVVLAGAPDPVASLPADESAAEASREEVEASERRRVLARAFPFLLLGAAALLLMGPELFRVMDLFGNRMNTMFKLSYQAWAVLAVACGYAAYWLFAWAGRTGAGRLYALMVLAVACVGVVVSVYYPAAAAYTKAAVPSNQATLDGLAHVARTVPEEYSAIHWLRQHYKDGETMVEAVGDDYSEYGRVSASTGVPAVLGWTFHEEQWRGSRKPFEGRQEAVRRLYQTGDVTEAKEILARYGVTYVYVGDRERAKYGTDGLAKFGELGEVAFQEGNVVIYRVGSE